MSDKYKILEGEKGYFLTFTVVDWVDVFTRQTYKVTLFESLKFCQEHKGLEIYGFCLMSNHLHLIAKASEGKFLPGIIRDFKGFTAKKLLEQISETSESRKCWMLDRFEFAGRFLSRIEKYKFWQDGYHAEQIYSPKIFYQKLNYIHQNPVKEMIVQAAEDYYYCSARNYAGLSSPLEIILESPELRTI
jgi:REP element-mobilizing transposase RayT